jgi:serine/threonine protein kinase
MASTSLPTRSFADGGIEGERVGPYRLLRVLGEGGMGIVYEADQVEPVRRRVALKLLKIGLDTKAFVARFEVERQALAVMNHPSIARVLDAGTVGTRPFYVMELVPGVPITDFCDNNRLTTKQRLRLFEDVCGAVQHAHQKGIIHRDLKPSNVLVAFQDDRPIPKVIDFGIAKALGRDLTERTLITGVGEAVGTPAYMSPEQWSSDLMDIDTRADIYSLGVVLFELLAGRLPHDAAELMRAGNGAPFLLQNWATPTPSHSLKTAGETIASIAYLRRTDPAGLLKEIRGDLDWITRKSIEPDRAQRYETAHELALDISRHLRAEPIMARPPSARYRAGRFLARHRAGAIIGALAAIGVAAFTLTTAVQARRIRRERDIASTEAAKSKALNTFLERTLLSPDPMDGIGRDATMVEALDSATARLGHEAIASPMVEASVKSAIGWAYFNLGDYSKAQPLLNSALSIRQTINPPDSNGLAESLLRSAQLDDKLARFASAQNKFSQALAIRRRIDRDTASALANALLVIGDFTRDRGDSTRALSLFRESARVYSATKDSAGLADVDRQLALLEVAAGDPETAEQHLAASLAYHRKVLGRHPLVAEELTILASVLADLHRTREAEAAYNEALSIGRETLGPEHDRVAQTMNNLGVLLSSEGRFDEAKAVLRDALLADERKLGKNNPTVGAEMLNLSKAICRGSSSYQEGEQWAAEAIGILARQPGPAWPVAQARVMRGVCLARLGRYDDAEREIGAGIAGLTAELGATHWRVDSARVRLREVQESRSAHRSAR